jgi:hypothetical protein
MIWIRSGEIPALAAEAAAPMRKLCVAKRSQGRPNCCSTRRRYNDTCSLVKYLPSSHLNNGSELLLVIDSVYICNALTAQTERPVADKTTVEPLEAGQP